MRAQVWIGRIVLTALLAAAVTGGCKDKVDADLVIVSPHPSNAKKEFERAFKAWHLETHGSPVVIEWREVGGTTSATQFLRAQYASSDTSGIDVYFGGGAPDHRMLADDGCTVVVELPPELLAAIPETIGGVRQYDAGKRWYGAAVSCFGILYNAKLLEARGIEPPKTWDDLASEKMYGHIETADATQSGSARAAYEMIVQSAPDWPSGWAKLLKIYANSKRYTSGSTDVANDVANGEVYAGAAIDFYGFTRIAQQGKSLGFVAVAGTTAFTPDPISMLKGAPHPEMAQRFIEFVLSDAGQALWCLPVGAEGGPARHTLYRQPIRRDSYTNYKGKMSDLLVDVFEHSGDFKLDEDAAGVRISKLHGPLMQAAAIDNRELLAKAWKAILDAGKPADLMAEFTSLPPDLADEATALATARKLGDDTARMAIVRTWQKFFEQKYEGLIDKASK